MGILSTADINRKLLAGAAESDDVEVVAVGSRDLARAEEFAQTWGIGRAYGSYEELLADPEVEAVYIPLPNTMHSEWSIKAVEAGKHVLCEKPFSRHVADVERAFDAAEATGMHLSEAFMYRHHPQTARLAELVADGAIGELRVIRTVVQLLALRRRQHPATTDVEGGALMDVGCYCVSGARLLGGEPESVVGAAHIGPSGTDWVFTGLMRFPGDVVALFDCGTSSATATSWRRSGRRAPVPRRPVALQRAGDRAAPRRHGRADRGRGRESLPARARGPERGDPRRAARRSSGATTRSARCGRSTRCSARPTAGRSSRSSPPRRTGSRAPAYGE